MSKVFCSFDRKLKKKTKHVKSRICFHVLLAEETSHVTLHKSFSENICLSVSLKKYYVNEVAVRYFGAKLNESLFIRFRHVLFKNYNKKGNLYSTLNALQNVFVRSMKRQSIINDIFWRSVMLWLWFLLLLIVLLWL